MTIVVLIVLGIALWVTGYAVANIVRAWADNAALDHYAEDDAVLRDVQELLSRKVMIMQLIQATEMDLEMERIAEHDAKALIRRYKREAVRVMRALDNLQGEAVDIDSARSAFEARAKVVEDRIAAGEDVWSNAAMQRHAGVAPRGEEGA